MRLPLTAALVALAASLLLAGAAHAQKDPCRGARHCGSVWDKILKVGSDGNINRYDRVALRQLGMDAIAIRQIVRETRDGKCLTKPEMTVIARGFIRRHNPPGRRPPVIYYHPAPRCH